MHEYKDIGPFLLRLGLGSMFLFTGIKKLLNPSAVVGMVSNLGFPIASFFAWILLISEIVFGAAVLLGWKVKYTIWPLVIVLSVATLMVYIPKLSAQAITVFFHLIAIFALIALALGGPGKWALNKN